MGEKKTSNLDVLIESNTPIDANIPGGLVWLISIIHTTQGDSTIYANEAISKRMHSTQRNFKRIFECLVALKIAVLFGIRNDSFR